MTQDQLAEAAGIHTTYVSDIELGKTKANICIYSQIAIAFGMTLSELFEPPEQLDDESVLLLISQIRGLKKSQRKVFLETVNAVLKGMKEF